MRYNGSATARRMKRHLLNVVTSLSLLLCLALVALWLGVCGGMGIGYAAPYSHSNTRWSYSLTLAPEGVRVDANHMQLVNPTYPYESARGVL